MSPLEWRLEVEKDKEKEAGGEGRERRKRGTDGASVEGATSPQSATATAPKHSGAPPPPEPPWLLQSDLLKHPRVQPHNAAARYAGWEVVWCLETADLSRSTSTGFHFEGPTWDLMNW